MDGHEITKGNGIVLGGVRIETDFGLKAHSDGDVILHAISDALINFSEGKSLGEVFRDDDPTWKGMDSKHFLKYALERLKGKGYTLETIDLYLFLNRPKLSPYREKIERSLRELTGARRVFLKVKRREGFFEGEGISCLCLLTLKPL